MLGKMLVSTALLALLSGCAGISSPATVSASPDLRRALGTALPGTKGATQRDQDAIDDHVAGGCKIALYKPQECARHNRIVRAGGPA